MPRHTTFKFCLDPSAAQCRDLAQHAGAARFAFNQCLQMVKTGLTQRKLDPNAAVPWTGFDLVNAFNAWKKTEDAGRAFVVDTKGLTDIVVAGLAWRSTVCQQVFEEAAIDLGRALAAWSDNRSGKRNGRGFGFPQFKKKSAASASFRIRNKHRKEERPAIRVGGPGSCSPPSAGTQDAGGFR